MRGTRGRNIIQRLTPSFPHKDKSWATSLIPFLFVMPGGIEKKHPELLFPRARFRETAVSKIRIKLHCNRARQSLQDMNGTIIISSSVKGSIDSHINEKAGNSKKFKMNSQLHSSQLCVASFRKNISRKGLFLFCFLYFLNSPGIITRLFFFSTFRFGSMVKY